MKITSIPQLARNANRLREIILILSKYGLADWISRLDLDFAKGLFKSAEGSQLAKVSHETRIRFVLTELGTTFIKLGQVLSTRADLLGQALATELTLLQDNAPADPPATVRATVEAELGQPLGELFAEFEDKPLASASIGQVHRARLKTGEDVVVKVQHPGIENRIRMDLDILVGVAGLVEQHLPELRRYRPRETAATFQRILLRELDFGREERNLQQFAANFAGHPTVRFPLPVANLSTSRVLTMDYLDGIKIAEPQRLRAQGFDLDEVARRGAEVFLEMIFRDGFYHADPHPGNILVLPGGVVGLLDAGMVGHLDERTREDIEAMLLAIASRDVEHLTSIITRVGAVPAELDPVGLRADLADFLAHYSGQSLKHLDLSGALTELIEIIRRYHIVLPAGIALLLKVLIMLEGTARLLSPPFNLTALIQPYQKKLLWRRFSPARRLTKLRRLFHEWEYLAEILPRSLTDLLQRVQTGRYDIHLQHQRLEPAINRLAFGMVSSALFLGSALLLSFRVEPAVSGISIPGALGGGLSLALGLRLLWAIRKSGHLDQRP
jgi:ubiquinone biosynthesis protein